MGLEDLKKQTEDMLLLEAQRRTSRETVKRQLAEALAERERLLLDVDTGVREIQRLQQQIAAVDRREHRSVEDGARTVTMAYATVLTEDQLAGRLADRQADIGAREAAAALSYDNIAATTTEIQLWQKARKLDAAYKAALKQRLGTLVHTLSGEVARKTIDVGKSNLTILDASLAEHEHAVAAVKHDAESTQGRLAALKAESADLAPRVAAAQAEWAAKSTDAVAAAHARREALTADLLALQRGIDEMAAELTALGERRTVLLAQRDEGRRLCLAEQPKQAELAVLLKQMVDAEEEIRASLGAKRAQLDQLLAEQPEADAAIAAGQSRVRMLEAAVARRRDEARLAAVLREGSVRRRLVAQEEKGRTWLRTLAQRHIAQRQATKRAEALQRQELVEAQEQEATAMAAGMMREGQRLSLNADARRHLASMEQQARVQIACAETHQFQLTAETAALSFDEAAAAAHTRRERERRLVAQEEAAAAIQGMGLAENEARAEIVLEFERERARFGLDAHLALTSLQQEKDAKDRAHRLAAAAAAKTRPPPPRTIPHPRVVTWLNNLEVPDKDAPAVPSTPARTSFVTPERRAPLLPALAKSNKRKLSEAPRVVTTRRIKIEMPGEHNRFSVFEDDASVRSDRPVSPVPSNMTEEMTFIRPSAKQVPRVQKTETPHPAAAPTPRPKPAVFSRPPRTPVASTAAAAQAPRPQRTATPTVKINHATHSPPVPSTPVPAALAVPSTPAPAGTPAALPPPCTPAGPRTITVPEAPRRIKSFIAERRGDPLKGQAKRKGPTDSFQFNFDD